jgi:hypothetical protein
MPAAMAPLYADTPGGEKSTITCGGVDAEGDRSGIGVEANGMSGIPFKGKGGIACWCDRCGYNEARNGN